MLAVVRTDGTALGASHLARMGIAAVLIAREVDAVSPAISVLIVDVSRSEMSFTSYILGS